MEIVPFEKHVLLNTCAEVQGNERIFMIGTWKKAFRKVLELLSISSERRAMQENFLFETSGNFYSITKNSGAFPKLLPHSSVRGRHWPVNRVHFWNIRYFYSKKGFGRLFQGYCPALQSRDYDVWRLKMGFSPIQKNRYSPNKERWKNQDSFPQQKTGNKKQKTRN